MVVDRIQSPFAWQRRDGVELIDDHAIGSDDQILIGLQIDEAEQHNDQDREHAGNRQGPAKGR